MDRELPVIVAAPGDVISVQAEVEVEVSLNGAGTTTLSYPSYLPSLVLLNREAGHYHDGAIHCSKRGGQRSVVCAQLEGRFRQVFMLEVNDGPVVDVSIEAVYER